MESSPLVDQARRLALSAALTRRAARALGAEALPVGIEPGALLGLAWRMAADVEALERAHHVRLTPAYPGLTAGVERAGAAVRIVLACRADQEGGGPLGVVFTSLIAGRAPYVAVAPPGAPIPPAWRPLE